MVFFDTKIIKSCACYPIGLTFESDGGPSPELLIDAFKTAFGDNSTTVHMTVKRPDGLTSPLSMQIVEITHADNSGHLIDFRANVDPADGFGRVVTGRCNGITGKTCISIERI